MMRFPFSYRQSAWLLFAAPAGLLLFAYYLQYFQGQEPCPLCMTQRLCFYGIAGFALLACFTHGSQLWRKLSNAGVGLFAALGGGVAIRQLWLQSLPPDQVPACGPSFEFIMKTFPLSEAVSIMFKGTGDCAEVTWTFLGLSIAAWSLVWFVLLFAAALFQLLRKA